MQTVDRALTRLLSRDVLGDAVDVSIEAPTKPWSAGLKRPTVNLFLFDVRENASRREVMVEPVRDGSGAIVARRPPPTRYDLFYVLSAWGCPTELEHQVLSAAVLALGSYKVIPPDLLGVDDPTYACFLTTAAGMKRGMMPMFSGDLKIQVDLQVTVPAALPGAALTAGPPVREAALVSVRPRPPAEIAAAGRRTARAGAAARADRDPFAVIRTGLAEAVAAMPTPPSAPPPGQRPGGAGSAGQRTPGAPPAGQRPAGAGGPPGAPAAPLSQRPPGALAGAPGAAAAAPPPLAVLRAALAQAAQAQAALAQAVAGLAAMLPAPAAAMLPAPAPAPAPAAAPAQAGPAPAATPPAAPVSGPEPS